MQPRGRWRRRPEEMLTTFGKVLDRELKEEDGCVGRLFPPLSPTSRLNGISSYIYTYGHITNKIHILD